MNTDNKIDFADPQVQIELLSCIRKLYPKGLENKILQKILETYDPPQRKVLKNLISSGPQLHRLILTVYYEPVEDWDFRIGLRSIARIFNVSDGQLIDFIIEDDYYIDAALNYYYKDLIDEHPFLRGFLAGLQGKSTINMRADIQKSKGRKGKISEIRKKQIPITKYVNGASSIIETTIDLWPEATIKHIKKLNEPEGFEAHVYLKKGDPNSWLHNADEHFIHYWWAWHNFPERRDAALTGAKNLKLTEAKTLDWGVFEKSKVTVYIYSNKGKLLEKYPFALVPKYFPLIKKVFKKLKGRERAYYFNGLIPDPLAIGDVISTFFEKATGYHPDEHGYFAGYIKNRLFPYSRDLRERGTWRIDIKHKKLSLDTDEFKDKEGNKMPLLESLWQDASIAHASQLDSIINKCEFNKWFSDPINKEILKLSRDCKTQEEVAQKVGISQPAVSGRMNKLAKSLIKKE